MDLDSPAQRLVTVGPLVVGDVSLQPPLFSALWYRVAASHPRLRAEVHVQRQQVRDQRWYLLVNSLNGRQYRINQQAYQFIGRCDGRYSVQQVWDALLQQLRDDAPTQDEVIQTLNQLDDQDLLTYETPPDARALVRRRDARARRRVLGFVNPFAIRIPLGDPSALLRQLDYLPRLMFNPIILCIWIAAIVAGVVGAAVNWESLTVHGVTYMDTPRYTLLAWACFPLVKALHELAHALAVRRWGGHVPGTGFTLFLLVPAPYVDASASAEFHLRRQRIAVGAAGMMIELLLAAVALAVWLNVQPGMVRDLAFVIMFIASVSTVLFNGNPLLPFDAYYILCDALDLPNLSSRSKAWWNGSMRRALCGWDSATPMQLSRGERKWLFVYAPLSFAYRLFVACLIVLWIGAYSTLFSALAALFFAVLIGKPLWTFAVNLRMTLPVGAGRWRASVIAGLVGAGFVSAVCIVPAPFHTVARGVVWLPDRAHVRPLTDGFITQVLVRDGEPVAPGQLLVVMEDPLLFAERKRLASLMEQLQAGRYTTLLNRSEQARNAEAEIARTSGDQQRIEERIGHLEVRAQTAGVAVMPHQADLPGTFARQGSTLGYILEREATGVRVAVPEHDAVLMRERTHKVEVRLAGQGTSLTADLVRDIPAATHELPSAALGDRGGGPHATDPADETGVRTQQPVVLVDLKLPSEMIQRIGTRAWVRFDHGVEPLAGRWYRQLRQVFLQHFNPVA